MVMKDSPTLGCVVALCCACLMLRLCSAREVLPPEAYFNRTIYPAVIDYAKSDRGYPELAIGLLSDVQYAEKEESQRRHFKLSLPKLTHAVNEFNANRTHLNMVIHLGDLVDEDMNRYLPVLTPVLKRLRFPLFQVLGNHDFLGLPMAEFGTVHTKLAMPSRYYSLHAGPNNKYRLIILDGNDIAIYSTVPGSATRKEAESMLKSLKNRRAKNAKAFNGALGASQMAWLKQQLNEACESSQTAFIFVHHPLRPKDEPTNLWNDIAAVALITGFPCAAAVINGHAHKFMYDFHHSTFRHVHFVTFGGMVQSPFTSFGFLDIYPDVMHVHGLIFGREIDIRLDIRSQAPLQGNVPPTSSSTRANATAADWRPTLANAGTFSSTVLSQTLRAATTAAVIAGVVSRPPSDAFLDDRVASLVALCSVIFMMFVVQRIVSRQRR